MRIETPRSGRMMGLAVAVAAAALAAAGLAMAATPAYAAPVGGKPAVHDGRKVPVKVNPYSPANGHAYRHGVVATKSVTAQMRAHPQVVTASNNLSYGGGVDGIGVTTGHEKVYLVFWGSQWGTTGTDANGNTIFGNDANGAAPRLQQLFKGLGTNSELWSGVMTQYCEGVAAGTQTCPSNAPHVAYPAGGALAGVWADTGSAAPAAATATQLGQTAVLAASHFGNTTAALNRNAQYVVLSAPGANPDNYKTGGFCAWHDWNGDVGAASSVGDVAFTNMPYVTDAGASCGQNFVNAGTAGTLDGVTMVVGHEYAETITDQNPAGGWLDSTGEENADKCAWLASGTARAQNIAFATGSFAMQGTWGNDTAGCQIAHSIVGTSTAPTVASPGNRTGTVGTATSVQMSATGGTAPYTWTATGLPNGLSINASTGLISGTPTTAATSSVTVAAKDAAGATGSTSFTWTIGAAGACSSPGQKIANSGFESGSASWTATPAVIGQNGPSEPAHAGTWNAWMDGYGTTHTDSVSQSVTIPAGCTSTLSFFLHIDSSETTTTTAFDKLTVQAGATTLATYSNLNKAAGYTVRTFNVSQFAGQTVTLKFTGTEDISLQTSFVLDDVTLTAS